MVKRHELAEIGSRYRRDSDWLFESLEGIFTDGEEDPTTVIINPKTKRCGPNSRMYIDRDVQHQNRATKSRQENFISSYNCQGPDPLFSSPEGILTDDEGDPLAFIVNPQAEALKYLDFL